MLPGFVVPALGGQGVGQAALGVRVRGLEIERGLELRDGFVHQGLLGK
jgi:hypothetical protein